MKYLVSFLTLVILCGFAVAEELKDLGEVVYRINCGFTADDLEDPDMSGGEQKGWLCDQLLEEGKGDWGAINGGTGANTVVHSPELKLFAAYLTQMYRSERWSVKGYEFKLPDGIYNFRLHFIEAWDKEFKKGRRVFSVDANGKEILKDFDLFVESGGYGQSVAVEIYGLKPVDGKIVIGFKSSDAPTLINGIEVFKTKSAEFKINKIAPGKK